MRQIFLFIAILTLFATTAFPQGLRYRNLVMEGAGVKGFAYAGALQVLDSLHVLQDIERVGGTSAGAIQAALLAVGYTPEEIMEVAANVPLRKFNDGAWFFGTGLKRLHNQFGYYKGKAIGQWMQELIAVKTGNGDITFEELHRLRNEKNYKDLYITGTDLTCQRLVIFSHESYPAMRVRDAVRISFSIPLYFTPVYIDDTGKVYEQPDVTKNLHLMVDGGVLSNYPLFLFDSTKYISASGAEFMPDSIAQKNMPVGNPETLGLLMENPEQLSYNEKQPGNYPIPINSLRDYWKALYQTIIDKANPDGKGLYPLNRTIAINNLHLFGRVRKLPKKTVNGLMESGREGVRAFFGKQSTMVNRK
jgi:NTE family protein